MSSSNSNPKLKSFVTEDEANDINVKRQEEWERVRRPEDPLDRPAEEHRSLFEQLQDEKEKVQQEHDEKYNLKNMVRGIDNDEAAFLEFASRQQAEIDSRRFSVTSEVQEYRSEVAQLQATMTSSSSGINVIEKKKPGVLQSNKKSQLELLAGVIKTKRKRSENEGDAEQSKPEQQSVTNTECETSSVGKVEDEPDEKKQRHESHDLVTTSLATEHHLSQQDPIGYRHSSQYKPTSIPSLGIYSDSSDSESSSSDSDILPSLFTVVSNHK